MANSERSFRDREGKARDLKNAIANFTPPFAPPDADVSVANFTALVGQAESKNTEVEGYAENYTEDADTRTRGHADTRMTVVKTIKTAVTQGLAYLESNKAWKSSFKAAKMAADKLRGVRPRQPKAPAPPPEGGPTPAEEKKRNQGEQAFTELAGHFGKFIAACTGAAGYAPPAAEISLGTLNGLLSQLKGLNESLSTLGAQLSKAQQQRQLLYYKEDGLADRFQAVKAAVKGQYGMGSANYGVVKVMKW